MTQLLEAYSGKSASGYDARRAKSRRWREEIAAMEALLPLAGAGKVLDCPFGTGRWVPQYTALGLDVVGVDLSADMLAQAQAKLNELPKEQAERFALLEGSIFDLAAATLPSGIDLVACIRFLNWIPLNDVKRVITVLSSIGTERMILGASVVPVGTGLVRRWWYDLSLQWINRRHPDRPQQYVHDETAFLQLLDHAGWRVVKQREIMRRNARVNYFYLLQRV